MNKWLLPLLFICSSFIALPAQTDLSNNKTDAVQQRVIGYRWNQFTAGAWQLTDSGTFTYSGTRGSSSIYNNQFDVHLTYQLNGSVVNPLNRNTITRNGSGWNSEFVTEAWSAGAYANDSRTLFTYDIKGNKLSATDQVWSLGSWVNSFRINYTYDTASYLLSETRYAWDGGAWAGSEKYEYAYNSMHNQLSEHRQVWNAGAWQENYRKSYTYFPGGIVQSAYYYETASGGVLVYASATVYTTDANGDRIQETNQTWNGTGWTNVGKSVFTYNANHQVTLRVNYTTSGNTSTPTTQTATDYSVSGKVLSETSYYYLNFAWVYSSRNLYTYDVNDWRADYIHQSYSANNWVNSTKYTYTYDNNGNADQTIYQLWTSGAWVNQTLRDFDYNSYNNPDYTIFKNWTNNAWVNDKEYYYYYEAYNITAMHETSGLLITAFPNPASEIINLGYSSKTTGDLELTVLDVTGRIILQRHEASVYGDNQLQIAIDDLSNGLYIIRLAQGNLAGQIKLVKQ